MSERFLRGLACALAILAPGAFAAPTLTPLAGTTPQQAYEAAGFPVQIGVVARDDNGQPLAGLPVTFTFPTAGTYVPAVLYGHSIPYSTTTDASGRAMMTPMFMGGSSPGPFTLTASSPTVPVPATFDLTTLVGIAQVMEFHSGFEQSTVINTVFQVPIRLRVGTLVNGNVVYIPRAKVEFNALPANGASGTLSGDFFDYGGNAFLITDENGWLNAPTVTANGTPGTWRLHVFAGRSLNAFVMLTNLAPPPPTPGVRTWTGLGADNRWSTPGNWSGNTLPQPFDRLVFPESPRIALENDLGSGPYDSLFFQGNNSYYIAGPALVLSGEMAIRSTGSGPTLAFPLRLNHPNAQIANEGGAMTISSTSGALVYADRLTVQVSGPLWTQLLTDLQGGELVAQGSGQVILRGNNSIGRVRVEGARLTALTPAALGDTANGTLVQNGGLIEFGGNSGDPEITFNEPLDLRGPGFVSPYNATAMFSGQPVSLNGPVSLGSSPFTILATSDATFRGAITGAAAVYANGGVSNARLTLANPGNAFTGDLQVTRLGLRLGASEVIPDTAMLWTDNDSSLDIGSERETVREWWCGGPVRLRLGAGQMRVREGGRFFSCNLELSADAGLVPTPGQVFVIVQNDSARAMDGTFTNLPEGAVTRVNGVDLRATYRHNGFSVALIALGAGSPASAIEAWDGHNQSFSVTGGSYIPIVARVLDASGRALPGARVTFSIGNCGWFFGQASVEVTSDVNGLASAPRVDARGIAGPCPVRATVNGTALTRDFFLYVYDPATVALTVTPQTISVPTNSTFQIRIRATSGGVVLPRVPVGIATIASGAANALVSSLVNTGEGPDGAVVNVDANPFAGQYVIEVSGPSSRVSVQVTQVAFGGPVSELSRQDMWWAGPGENGWGMSIVQHGDTLFSVIYGYDASGAPKWWVMSGGTWNAAHTAYTGLVYTPRGSPFFAYDPSRLVVGAPTGSITITFLSDNSALLDFSIEGVTGRKGIQRQGFGPLASAARSDLGDMWWGGGEQNGWGIAVLQQYATLFSVWFTYDANGVATWYVMPSGTWTSPDTYEGRIYRTRGSPWLGPYDVNALQVIDVGSYRLRFTGEQATFGYEIDGRVGSLSLVRQGF